MTVEMSLGDMDFDCLFGETESGLDLKEQTLRIGGRSLRLRPCMSREDIQTAVQTFMPAYPFAHDEFVIDQNRFLLYLRAVGPAPIRFPYSIRTLKFNA